MAIFPLFSLPVINDQFKKLYKTLKLFNTSKFVRKKKLSRVISGHLFFSLSITFLTERVIRMFGESYPLLPWKLPD